MSYKPTENENYVYIYQTHNQYRTPSCSLALLLFGSFGLQTDQNLSTALDGLQRITEQQK